MEQGTLITLGALALLGWFLVNQTERSSEAAARSAEAVERAGKRSRAEEVARGGEALVGIIADVTPWGD